MGETCCFLLQFRSVSPQLRCKDTPFYWKRQRNSHKKGENIPFANGERKFGTGNFLYTLSFFVRNHRHLKICCLAEFRLPCSRFPSAVQQSSVRRAAEFRPPCSRFSSAVQQKLFRRAADFRAQAALFYRCPVNRYKMVDCA